MDDNASSTWTSVWPAGEQARARPALIDASIDATSSHVLTYGQLLGRADALARGLHEGGVRRGDRVAILCLNRTEVFEALLACARLGAALVPLNWRLAPAELAAITADCAPAALLHEPDLQDATGHILAKCDIGLVSVLPNDHGDDRAAPDPAPPAPAPDDVAMILYTSGTTGRPKGAMLPWRQVAFNARATAALCDLGPDDRCLACLPLFHTGGLNCLAMPILSVGGAAVLMRKFDPHEALDAMERHRVTCFIGVPTMYQMLLDAGLASRSLPALRWRLLGGAPCPDALLDAYERAGQPLNQGYGLTEVGPNCFTLGIGGAPRGSVGVPVPGTEARLVRDDGRIASREDAGVGELWLRGPHVCAGYWHRPEETARALDADGWFHTGDYARRDAQGYFSIVGRKKEMFISGGENVYPAEVENTLASHPAVAEVAVVGVPDERWGEVGLAVIVPADAPAAQDAQDALAADLRRWTRERLATYKVPRHWKLVRELPKTPTGKVRKETLPALLS